MVKIAETLQIFILVSTAHPKIPIWRTIHDQLAVKDSRCTRSAILNLTASETGVPVLERKNTSAGIQNIYDRVLPSGFAMYANFLPTTLLSFSIGL